MEACIRYRVDDPAVSAGFGQEVVWLLPGLVWERLCQLGRRSGRARADVQKDTQDKSLYLAGRLSTATPYGRCLLVLERLLAARLACLAAGQSAADYAAAV
eukprot:839746-Lingulodinium_polyedra.AAC.1